MKTCPAVNCTREIEDRRFCCSSHWNKLPDFYRDKVNDARYQHRKDLISSSQLHEAEAEVCRALGWDYAGLDSEGTFGNVLCKKCGQAMLMAHREDGSGMICVQEVSNAAEKYCFRERLFVLIGFVARPNGEHYGDVYARFREHTCAKVGRV